MKDFEAVVFDMDGVILDSETPLIRAFEDRARAWGLEGDIDAICHTCLGVKIDTSRANWRRIYGEDFDYDKIRAEAYELFMARTFDGVPLKPHIREMLEWLKMNGKKIALASSTPRSIVEKELTTVGLIDYFDALICGDMVARSKPYPDIFLKACEAVSVAPGKAVGIEDSFMGVRAVKAAGMLTVMVPDILQPDEETRALTDYVGGTLEDVRDFLLK